MLFNCLFEWQNFLNISIDGVVISLLVKYYVFLAHISKVIKALKIKPFAVNLQWTTARGAIETTVFRNRMNAILMNAICAIRDDLILITTWRQYACRQWLTGQSAWLSQWIYIGKFKTGNAQIFFYHKINYNIRMLSRPWKSFQYLSIVHCWIRIWTPHLHNIRDTSTHCSRGE